MLNSASSRILVLWLVIIAEREFTSVPSSFDSNLTLTANRDLLSCALPLSLPCISCNLMKCPGLAVRGPFTGGLL